MISLILTKYLQLQSEYNYTYVFLQNMPHVSSTVNKISSCYLHRPNQILIYAHIHKTLKKLSLDNTMPTNHPSASNFGLFDVILSVDGGDGESEVHWLRLEDADDDGVDAVESEADDDCDCGEEEKEQEQSLSCFLFSTLVSDFPVFLLIKQSLSRDTSDSFTGFTRKSSAPSSKHLHIAQQND